LSARVRRSSGATRCLLLLVGSKIAPERLLEVCHKVPVYRRKSRRRPDRRTLDLRCACVTHVLRESRGAPARHVVGQQGTGRKLLSWKPRAARNRSHLASILELVDFRPSQAPRTMRSAHVGRRAASRGSIHARAQVAAHRHVASHLAGGPASGCPVHLGRKYSSCDRDRGGRWVPVTFRAHARDAKSTADSGPAGVRTP